MIDMAASEIDRLERENRWLMHHVHELVAIGWHHGDCICWKDESQGGAWSLKRKAKGYMDEAKCNCALGQARRMLAATPTDGQVNK